MPDHNRDPALRALKLQAESGTDRTPEFNRGVLSVVEEIELKGSFVPDESLYDSKGTPSAAHQDDFSNGVRHAEAALRRYGRVAGT